MNARLEIEAILKPTNLNCHVSFKTRDLCTIEVEPPKLSDPPHNIENLFSPGTRMALQNTAEKYAVNIKLSLMVEFNGKELKD